MFEFEKLSVYQKAKSYNSEVLRLMSNYPQLDGVSRDQLRRASFSIMLNIAEGSSRYTKPSKANFYVIALGSAFECVAIFDFLKDQKTISEEQYERFYSLLDELSRMLFQMIKNLGGTDRSR